MPGADIARKRLLELRRFRSESKPFRFEDLPECFSEYRPGILPHEHRTTRLPTTDYREADLREFYRDDFVLCGAA